MAPFCLPYGRLGLQGAKRLGYKANPTEDYESIFFKIFRPHVRFVIVVCIWLVDLWSTDYVSLRILVYLLFYNIYKALSA